MVYQIKIKGYLQAHWFEDLELEYLDDQTTLIRGDFQDQASLYGALRRIRDLGIALISLNPIQPPQKTTQDQKPTAPNNGRKSP